MKKIALVISDLRGNGAERFVLTLAKAFQEIGAEPHVVLLHDFIQLPVPEKVKIHVFDSGKYRWIPKAIRINLLRRRLDSFMTEICNGAPDLVLSNSGEADSILSDSRLRNVYLVVHNTLSKYIPDDSSRRKRMERLSRKFSKKEAVAVSQGVLDDFEQLFPECRARCIHNPVDRDEVLEKADAAVQLHPTLPEDFIVHVGKFKRAKRHDILIAAYAKSGVRKPLVLLGEGELMPQARKLAISLGVEDRVIFHGFCENPYPLMKKASFMVMSSDFEGFSIAMLEALALGVPLISTDCPSGPSEILPPQNLVPVRAVELLAEKIKAAAEHPGQYHVPFDEKFLPMEAAKKYLALSL